MPPEPMGQGHGADHVGSQRDIVEIAGAIKRRDVRFVQARILGVPDEIHGPDAVGADQPAQLDLATLAAREHRGDFEPGFRLDRLTGLLGGKQPVVGEYWQTFLDQSDEIAEFAFVGNQNQRFSGAGHQTLPLAVSPGMLMTVAGDAFTSSMARYIWRWSSPR